MGLPSDPLTLHRPDRFTAALALCSLLILAGCGQDSVEEPAANGAQAYSAQPNVLLVTVDTLRADHLGCYGYYRDTSPQIDAFAAQSVVFDRALATSATTLPSHLSLMTGLYPHQHGYTANKGVIHGPFKPQPGRRLAAQFFQDAGYITAGFISGQTLKKTTGIHQGFDTWSEPGNRKDPVPWRTAEETNAKVLPWLRKFAKFKPKKPFFLWVHYWDPHEPNDPPEPYRSMFKTDAQLEALLAERQVDADLLQDFFSASEIARIFYPDLLEDVLSGKLEEVPPISHESILQLYNFYDGDVRYIDDQFAKLLAVVDGSKLAQNTIVVFASDHGQALGQHNWLEHGRIQVENTRVPLMVRFPGDLIPQPQRVERLVSLVDLLPSIIARIPSGASWSFLQQASGSDVFDPGFDRRFTFSHRAERDRDWEPGRKFGMSFDKWRYYYLEEGPDQLFDLAADPGELHDVAELHPDKVRRLRKLAKLTLSEKAAQPLSGGDLSAEERAAIEQGLRESGYLGEGEDLDDE